MGRRIRYQFEPMMLGNKRELGVGSLDVVQQGTGASAKRGLSPEIVEFVVCGGPLWSHQLGAFIARRVARRSTALIYPPLEL
jgi:hypothetical protein